MEELIAKILTFLPASKIKNFVYDSEDVTDRPIKFIVSEYVREAMLEVLKKEVPHGVAVVVTRFEENGGTTHIEADIVCERNSHKGIIIGKGGETLKKIGIKARRQAEALIGGKVMLKLFVKVEEGWKDKPNKLSDLGYN